MASTPDSESRSEAGQVEKTSKADVDMAAQNGQTGGGLSQVAAGKEWLEKRRASLRPWSEFFNYSKVARPKKLSQATKRFTSNVEQYQSNYLFVSIGLALYCVITSPLLLIALAFIVGGSYYISVKNESKPVQILGYSVAAREQYFLVLAISLPFLFLASAGSAVFWIVGASLVVIALHAVMMPTEDELNAPFELQMEDV